MLRGCRQNDLLCAIGGLDEVDRSIEVRIEKDCVEVTLSNQTEKLCPVGDGERRKTLPVEDVTREGKDDRVAVSNEYFFGGRGQGAGYLHVKVVSRGPANGSGGIDGEERSERNDYFK